MSQKKEKSYKKIYWPYSLKHETQAGKVCRKEKDTEIQNNCRVWGLKGEEGLTYKDSETEQKCFKKMVLWEVEKAANTLRSRRSGLNLYTRSLTIWSHWDNRGKILWAVGIQKMISHVLPANLSSGFARVQKESVRQTEAKPDFGWSCCWGTGLSV